MSDFQTKYNATPFDSGDPRDVLSERARKIVVGAFIDALDTVDAKTGQDSQDILAGLLVGVVGIMIGSFESTDQNHAAIRASFLQVIPWAVDVVRSMENLPPLSDGN